MPSPKLGAPRGDDWISRKFREMQTEIDELRTARSSQAMTIRDPYDNHIVAIIGLLPPTYNRPDGTPQSGMMLFREDASLAAVLGDASPTVAPFKQAWQIVDRANNVVFADDTNGGQGIAIPLIPLTPLTDTDITRWPSTTSTTWTQILVGDIITQNPGMQFDFYVNADPGTTGKIRLLVDGNVVATSPTITSAFSIWGANYFWAAGWTFLGQKQLSVEAEVLSGSGTVRATNLLLTGVLSP